MYNVEQNQKCHCPGYNFADNKPLLAPNWIFVGNLRVPVYDLKLINSC